jgi:hypothetical protein
MSAGSAFRRLRPVLAALAAACVAACAPRAEELSVAREPPPVAADAPGAEQARELTEATEDILAFLRGETPFGRIRVADTVTLYLSPEGGGLRAAVPRERLRDPRGWELRSADGRSAYAFAPPPGWTRLTARVGRHFNCLEYPLASRYPELARLPHVGTRLEPAGAGSCLQSWNLTFVFDAGSRPPVLVAVVRDQWEW